MFVVTKCLQFQIPIYDVCVDFFFWHNVCVDFKGYVYQLFDSFSA
jgi:hypothetical protein